jgi:WD40 repeat protein
MSVPEGSIWTQVFDPQGKLLASSGGDWRVRLWDPLDGSLVQEVEALVDEILFSPDGRLLALAEGVSDYDIQLWDVGQARLLRTLENAGEHIAFSPDGVTLAAVHSSDGAVVYDLITASHLVQPEWSLFQIVFSRTARTAAETGGQVSLWMYPHRRCIAPNTGRIEAHLFPRIVCW